MFGLLPGEYFVGGGQDRLLREGAEGPPDPGSAEGEDPVTDTDISTRFGDIELSTRFGPIDLREGGEVFYLWPQARTRDFVITHWSACVISTGWSLWFVVQEWFGDNCVVELRDGSAREQTDRAGANRSALIDTARDAHAHAKERPSLLRMSLRSMGVQPSEIATPIACGDRKIETWVSLPPLTKHLHPHAIFDFSLYGYYGEETP